MLSLGILGGDFQQYSLSHSSLVLVLFPLLGFPVGRVGYERLTNIQKRGSDQGIRNIPTWSILLRSCGRQSAKTQPPQCLAISYGQQVPTDRYSGRFDYSSRYCGFKTRCRVEVNRGPFFVLQKRLTKKKRLGDSVRSPCSRNAKITVGFRKLGIYLEFLTREVAALDIYDPWPHE